MDQETVLNYAPGASRSITLSGTVTDESAVELLYVFNEASTSVDLASDGSFSVTITMPNLQNSMTFQATDAQENASETQIQVRYIAQGRLDSDFNTDGRDTFDLGASLDTFTSTTVDQDNRLIAVSYSRNPDYQFAVVRYDQDGNLDTTFGGGDGIAVTADPAGGSGTNDFPWAVTTDENNKIIVVGHGTNASGNQDMIVVRYTSTGVLDTTFGGGDGIFTHNVAGTNDENCHQVYIDSDGKIWAFGSSSDGADHDLVIWKLNSNGTLDTSFDSDGYVVIADSVAAGDDIAYGATFTDDDHILVVGESGGRAVIWKFNTDGSLDTTFGSGDGFVALAHEGLTGDKANAVIVDSSGDDPTYVIAGEDLVSVTDRQDFMVWKLHSDGSKDTSFGESNGLIALHGEFANDEDGATGIFMDAANNYVVGGYVFGSVASDSQEDLFIIRLTNDGEIDTSFNADDGFLDDDDMGGATSNNADRALSIVQDQDGRIYAAGWTEGPVDGAIWRIK
ncbi:MAG: hypothetical protein R3A45_03995 [Bdellovibrionota bacterium]